MVVKMKSNDAYGRLVECLFPHHIRLSIHAHSNVEKVHRTIFFASPSELLHVTSFFLREHNLFFETNGLLGRCNIG